VTISVHEDKLDDRRVREDRETSLAPFTERSIRRRKQLSADLPEFGEYARRKYPDELDEGLIVLIEELITLQRNRQNLHGTSVT